MPGIFRRIWAVVSVVAISLCNAVEARAQVNTQSPDEHAVAASSSAPGNSRRSTELHGQQNVSSGLQQGETAGGAVAPISQANAAGVAQQQPQQEVQQPVTPDLVYQTAMKFVTEDYLKHSAFNDSWPLWSHAFDGKLKTMDDAHKAIETMLSSLKDPEVGLQPPNILCPATGLRVGLSFDTRVPVVLHAFGFAAAAGIKNDDQIISIDGSPTKGSPLSVIATRLDGAPNTLAHLEYQRGGKTYKCNVRRQRVCPTAVTDFQDIDGGRIGYIRVGSLASADPSGDVVGQLQMTLQALYLAKGIILDLRDNTGGGSMKNTVQVASTFLSSGMILTMLDADGDRTGLRAVGVSFDKRPLVLLVNHGTARGAEALALAFHDNGRAVVVGSKSQCEDKINDIKTLPDGSQLFLPIGQIFSPKDKAISEVGVEPDIPIEVSPQEFERKGPFWLTGRVAQSKTGEIADSQLARAAEEMRKILASMPPAPSPPVTTETVEVGQPGSTTPAKSGAIPKASPTALKGGASTVNAGGQKRGATPVKAKATVAKPGAPAKPAATAAAAGAKLAKSGAAAKPAATAATTGANLAKSGAAVKPAATAAMAGRNVAKSGAAAGAAAVQKGGITRAKADATKSPLPIK